ncbi:hypothetical protein CLIB1444_10S03862 [[Candida] jaroonii]|uniref:Uncharacterized protein n=1 Tax=[Candida] jaroonii TaxID=467808 RepID=A0ACA9YD66_9ASCO|nr:hypothetical protein CLIB1444_10S03862 [[Candida] jaroonii]
MTLDLRCYLTYSWPYHQPFWLVFFLVRSFVSLSESLKNRTPGDFAKLVIMEDKSMSYSEQQRRQIIMNSLENRDYLLIIANQQNKSVQQVKYELMEKLVKG